MHKRLTVILAGLTMVGPLAIDTYLPSFLAMSQHFAVGPALIQQTLSIFLFPFAIMMLFYGTLSDSFGRRPIILGSLALYIVGCFGAALAPSFAWLLAARALQGFAAGAGSVVGRAIVRDRLAGPDAQRMLSHIMMVFGLAPAIAPILGGWLQVNFGWQSIFVMLGIFGLTMLAVCYWAMPESLPREARQPFQPRPIAINYGRVISHPQFLWMALAVGAAFGGFSLYIGSAAHFVMTILHLPETAFGWMFIPLISGMVAGSGVAARYAERVSPTRMIGYGYGVMALGALTNVAYNAVFAASVPWAVLPLLIYSFGVALLSPAMTILLLDLFPHNRGLVSSLQSFVQMFVFALVSGLVAPLLFDSALKLSLGVLAALLISLTCWLLGRPTLRTSTS